MNIAVLGLGEAGSLYAHGLAERGAIVRAFDPLSATTVTGITRTESLREAIAGAEVVLSLVGASASGAALDEALPAMAAGSLYADMNTATPERKLELSLRAASAGIPFVDVAIMSPVPRSGVATPLVVSGTGATLFAERLRPLGLPIDEVGTEAGLAAGLKLIRSVFMKGLAGIVLESLDAATKLNAEAWMRAQIVSELGPDAEALVDRLVDGTRRHAARREHEMRDVRDFLQSIGSPSWMTDGSIHWLAAVGAMPPIEAQS